MKNRLERRYGWDHLHFITCSCYRRLPFFASGRRRDLFLKVLREARDHYNFALLGYVVMPAHIHLLISEPNVGTPSTIMQVLKQRVSRSLRRRKRNASVSQMRFWSDESLQRYPRFWQRRFYDFNVWSSRKKNEKLNYMHFNLVRRGLVAHSKEWVWSSYRFYAVGGPVLCPPNPEWRATHVSRDAAGKTHVLTSKRPAVRSDEKKGKRARKASAPFATPGERCGTHTICARALAEVLCDYRHARLRFQPASPKRSAAGQKGWPTRRRERYAMEYHIRLERRNSVPDNRLIHYRNEQRYRVQRLSQ